MLVEALNDAIPTMLKVYLRSLGDNQYLLRLHNMDEYNNVSYTSPFKSAVETTLTYN